MSKTATDNANRFAERKSESKFAAVAKDLGLTLEYTDDVVEQLVDDILLTMRGRSTELDGKIKEAWLKRHPKGIYVQNGPNVAGSMLVGPPGHGKTSVMRLASKIAAELVGLEFVDNPDDTMQITEKHFLFLSLEFAGVNSALQIKGIPYKKQKKLAQDAKKVAAQKGTDPEVEYLSFLKDYSLSTLGQAGGATLLLDDLLNATQEMINVALPLTEEKRFASTHLGKHVYVGATGNLGARDGTKTTAMSAALSGRMRMLMVRDNKDSFVRRLRAEFGGSGEQGQFSDMYFASFVERYGEEVIEDLPESADRMGGYGSPRTLMKAANANFYELARVGGVENGLDAMDRFDTSVGSFIGMELGRKLKSYLMSAYQMADPIARMAIYQGKITGEKFEGHIKDMMDTQMDGKSQDFLYQYVYALADHGTRALEARINALKIPPGGDANNDLKFKEFEVIAQNFANAIVELDGAPYTLSIDLFKDRMMELHGDFLRLQSDELAKTLDKERLSFNDRAWHIYMEALIKECSPQKRKLLNPILSEAGQYTNTSTFDGAAREESTPMAPTPAKAPKAPKARNLSP